MAYNQLQNFTATEGDEYGQVKLEWDIPDNIYWGNHFLSHTNEGMVWGSGVTGPPQNPNYVNFTGQDYQITKALIGYPNPGWAQFYPSLYGDSGGFTPNGNIYDEDSIGWGWQFWNTANGANTAIAKPAFLMHTEDIIDALGEGAEGETYIDGTMTLYDGTLQFFENVPQNIPDLNEQHVLWEDIEANLDSGLYKCVVGLQWNHLTESYQFDWNISQQALGLGQGMTTSPWKHMQGCGVWYGSSFKNTLFNPLFGKEKYAKIDHQFFPGGFYIVGRKGYSPTDAQLGNSTIGPDGTEHPSEEQLSQFLDPGYDSNTYFSRYIKEPNTEEESTGRMSRNVNVGDMAPWYFIILYSDGHDTYSQEFTSQTPNVNQQNVYSNGYGPYSGFKPWGPMSNPVPNNPFKNILTIDSDNDAIIQASNTPLVLDGNRQSPYPRAEAHLGMLGVGDNYFPFINDWNQELEAGGLNSEGWDMDDGSDFEAQTANGFLEHYPVINGKNYNNLKSIQWASYSENNSWAVSVPNSNMTAFVDNFQLNTLPHIRRDWKNTYQIQWMEERLGGMDLSEKIESLIAADGIQTLTPEELASFQNMYKIGQFGIGHTLYSSFGYQLEAGITSAFYTYGLTENNHWPSWYESEAPIYYQNDQWPYYEPIQKLSPLYLRMDNTLYFALPYSYVPDNMLIRIINRTASGDFENYQPEDVEDMNEAPVFYEFTADDLVTSPFWDFDGSITSDPAFNAWNDNAYNPHLSYVERRRTLKIQLPLDFSFDDNGDVVLEIKYGAYNPAEPINYDAAPCSNLGGQYGMRIFTTEWQNNSRWSDGGYEDIINIRVHNTPPSISLEPLENVNIPITHGIEGSNILYGSLHSDIPVMFSNFYEVDEGAGPWMNLGNNWLPSADGEYIAFNGAEWSYDEPQTTHWGEHIIHTEAIAVAYAIDIAGNRASDYQLWDFKVDLDGNSGEQRWTYPHTPTYIFGNYYPIEKFRQDAKAIGASQPGLDNTFQHYFSASLNMQGSNYTDAHELHLYGFSSNYSMLKFTGHSSVREALAEGYWSLETMYNNMFLGTQYYLEDLANEFDYGTTNGLPSEDMKNFYTTCDQLTLPGFRAVNLPTEAEVDEYLATTDGALKETAGNILHDGGFLAPHNAFLTFQSSYGHDENLGAKAVVLHYDPWFYRDPSDPDYQYLGETGLTHLRADFGCVNSGKVAQFPFCTAGYNTDFMGPKALCPQTGGFGQTTMTASSYYTPYNGIFCDVNPGYNFDYDTGTGDVPETAQEEKITYWYSPLGKRWDVDTHPYDATALTQINPISAFTGKDGEMYLTTDKPPLASGAAQKYSMYINEAGSDYKAFNWISKKITMQASSQKKMYYKIRAVKLNKGAESNISVSVRTDENPAYINLGFMGSEISKDFKVPKSMRKGRWIQIKLEGQQAVNKETLSSLTVIWRQKSIK